MKTKIVCASILSLMVSTVAADEDVLAKTEKITSKLEVINNLGIECESHLQVSGLKGADSAACASYLRNTKGDFLSSIGSECSNLLEWFEEKRQFILKNPNFSESHPAEAATLLVQMKAVKATCSTDYMKSFKYLLKPMRTMEALNSLE